MRDVSKLNKPKIWGEVKSDFSLGFKGVKNLRRERGARSVQTDNTFSLVAKLFKRRVGEEVKRS